MPPKKEEIDEIIRWCDAKKKERAAVYIVERNPFKDKFDWNRNTINIEIDRPLIIAAKTSLVYDSVTKKLYQYMNGKWIPLNMLSIK